MRRVLAIAALTVRGAVRSRVLLILGLMLAVAVVGLPLTVRGDGTIGGLVQIMLRYALGVAFVLLAVAMVWSGCAGIATEVRDRQIQMVTTKPVRALEVWLGKWIGLLALLAVLLGGAGFAVFGLLHWTTRPGAIEEADRARLRDEVLVARAEIPAIAPEVDAPARAEFERRRSAGELPADRPPEEVFRMLRRTMLAQAFSVPAGGRNAWLFRVPRRPAPGRPFLLQFRFEKSVLDLEPVRLRWTFEAADGTQRRETVGEYRPRAVYTIAVPPEALGPDGRLRIGCEHIDPVPASLLFEPGDGLVLLQYRGAFAGNYARAIGVLFARLAFLTALGLAAGTLFSLPVAGFASVSGALLILLGDYIERLARAGVFFGAGPDAGWSAAVVNRFLSAVFRALSFAIQPLRGPDPLDLLATGRWIAWGLVGREMLIQVVVYGGLLALCSAAVLRRRELGLPA